MRCGRAEKRASIGLDDSKFLCNHLNTAVKPGCLDTTNISHSSPKSLIFTMYFQFMDVHTASVSGLERARLARKLMGVCISVSEARRDVSRFFPDPAEVGYLLQLVGAVSSGGHPTSSLL